MKAKLLAKHRWQLEVRGGNDGLKEMLTSGYSGCDMRFDISKKIIEGRDFSSTYEGSDTLESMSDAMNILVERGMWVREIGDADARSL